MSTFRYSYVSLHCVVLMSVHYRLCLVTVHVEVLQNGRLVRFIKRTDCRCVFSCSVCDQTATSLRLSRAAVPKVVTTYTDHGTTSSAERSCGRKPKLSERDRRTLQKAVSEKGSQKCCSKDDSRRFCLHINSPTRASQILQQ